MSVPPKNPKKQNLMTLKRNPVNRNTGDELDISRKKINDGASKDTRKNVKVTTRHNGKISPPPIRKHGPLDDHGATSTSKFYKPQVEVEKHSFPKPDNSPPPVSNYINTMDLKTFLRTSLHIDEVTPFVLENAILKAISQRNVQILKLVIDPEIEKLDFRGILPYPDREQEPIKSVLPERLDPPNEFDWFAGDKMGKIMSIHEAFQLFSIMRVSECEGNLHELKINARRLEYWTISSNQMNLIIDSLVRMKTLTTLVLRGMADNIMLRGIGGNCPSLKHLDISFSQHVTNDGILRLFYHDDVDAQSAYYLIPTWTRTHKDKMWPIANSIEYLDCSWTSITSQARKMLNLIPGSYMFKRLFAISENEAYAHHIFIHQHHDWSTSLRMKDNEKEFESKLQQYSGKRGAGCFMKFLLAHPWKNLHLTIFKEKINNEDICIVPNEETEHHSKIEESYITTGIITPTKDEKRIQGLAFFESGNLTQVYSIFPINLNHLGQCCQQLQKVTGTLSDIWKTDFSLFPTLTEINIFAEPNTLISLLTFSPQLKKVRVRIIRLPITDDLLLDAMKKSMCRKTLEELWIAPGTHTMAMDKEKFRNAATSTTNFDNPMASIDLTGIPNSNISNKHNSYQESNGEMRDDYEISLSTGSTMFHFNETYTEEIKKLNIGKNIKIDELTQLTITSVKKLIEYCPNLSRLGNFAWWNVTGEEINKIATRLSQAQKNAKSSGSISNRSSEIKLIWDNNIISASSIKKPFGLNNPISKHLNLDH